ncbi:MAG: hypothetical protein ISQ34_03420 [Rickettsiales bacterium]|nr:hypothetical protein [Rickettsiales bacterium]
MADQSKIKQIIQNQITFDGADELDKFVNYFCNLYRIEIFKDGLDLILTKLQQKELRFEIKQIKGWDTNLGCFLTQQQSVYDKTLGKFFNKSDLKIILKQLSYNVLAHEMAHALEFESKINLGEEFRKCIGYDMKNREPSLLTLKAQKQRLMVDALKSYPPHQFLSELFARYFELLSTSRNVCATGEYATPDVMEFFENTTNFVTQIFNPQIKNQINQNIASITKDIAQTVRLSAPQQNFQEKVGSFQKRNQGSWSKSIHSNAMWQAGFKERKNIEDK